jgi:AcrR family transcriptional regulator
MEDESAKAKSSAATVTGAGKPKTSRKRRTAGEARKMILNAAEVRLTEVGPEGLKLQEIARDVGVSHPAILHHFGSRQGLVTAVVQRALDSLRNDVLALVRDHMSKTQPVDVPGLLQKTYEVLAQRGHARLLAWLILTGTGVNDEGLYLRGLAEASHVKMGESTSPDGSEYSFEDSLFLCLLIGYTSMGAGIAGDILRRSAGLAKDADAADRFNDWFARLIEKALMGNEAPSK